ncbi:MAG TPA: DNA alkylation repair protein [Anaerolineae bacterium]|nr:DNA alkylation repair protein [Anaerolineae bacterium]
MVSGGRDLSRRKEWIEAVMSDYVKKIERLFEMNTDPVQAAQMKKYMRDQFEYLGIKTPLSKALQNEFYAKYGLPEIAELDFIVRELWKLPHREYKYVAMRLLDKFEKKLAPQFIKTIEHLIVTDSWWDTVDLIASHQVGGMFKRYPDIKTKYLAKWRRSKNMWLRRTTLLFQLGYKTDTDFALLCKLIQENLGSDEFFINKAIGWSLRQYAHINPSPVRKFVKTTRELHPLSRREAMKHLE